MSYITRSSFINVVIYYAEPYENKVFESDRQGLCKSRCKDLYYAGDESINHAQFFDFF